MNIRITTFQRAHNYGALLQVYALQEFLKKYYNVKIIDYENKRMNLQYNPNKIKRPTLKWTIKNFIEILLYRNKMITRYNNFNNFINNKLILTNKINHIKDIDLDKVDVLITGSDQVWNWKLTNGLDDIYFLNFGNTIKRISYAASLGNSKINEDYKKEFKEKISKIDKISVREESGKKAINEIVPNKEIEVVLDPTLLLKKAEWENFSSNSKNEKNKYILAYIVEKNSEQIKIVNHLSKKTGLKVIHFEKRNFYNNSLKSAYTANPQEFVELIRNAEYIVTTSFHATVFSIIFNKKFWVVPHKSTGSRVTDLLKKLEISNRALYTYDEFNNRNYDEEIDYEKVNKILEKEREKSINWLIDAIEK